MAELKRTDLNYWEQKNYQDAQKKARRKRRVAREDKNFDELAQALADHEIVAHRRSEQHWDFLSPTERADWWPSSGKLVFNKQWNNPQKATSTQELWLKLRKQWGLSFSHLTNRKSGI